MKTRKDTDYLYASTRLRAIEARGLTAERLMQLADSKSQDELQRALADAGYQRAEGDRDDGDMLDRAGLAVYALLSEIAPDGHEFDLFRYRTDVHNLKSILKCEIRGVPSEPLLLGGGTVEPALAVSSCAARDFSPFPEHMAAAAPEALAAYEKTADPQSIDLPLDRACFADMAQAARATRCEAFSSIVAARADLTNISMFVRVRRMGKPFSFFEEAQLPGGTLETSFFAECFEAGEEMLWARLWLTEYDRLAAVFRGGGSAPSASAVEKHCEEEYLRRVGMLRRVPFGREVLLGHLLATENEIQNIRILLAGKRCGLPADTIRERMRTGLGNL